MKYIVVALTLRNQ